MKSALTLNKVQTTSYDRKSPASLSVMCILHCFLTVICLK